MEDTRGDHGIGFAFEQDFGQMFVLARAAAGDDRHADGFTDPPRDDEIVSGPREGNRFCKVSRC